MTNQTIELSKLPWQARFRTNKDGQIMINTALVIGNKIGAYNPLGQLILFDRDRKVLSLSNTIHPFK